MPKGLRQFWAQARMASAWMVVMGMSLGQMSIWELLMCGRASIRRRWLRRSSSVVGRSSPVSVSMMLVGVPSPAKLTWSVPSSRRKSGSRRRA